MLASSEVELVQKCVQQPSILFTRAASTRGLRQAVQPVNCNEIQSAARALPQGDFLIYRGAPLAPIIIPMSESETKPRILLVRLSALGDVIHAMPVACALRARFPQALIVWAVEERAGDIVQGHSAIDYSVVLPRGWLRSPAKVWRLRKRLKAFAFDTALDIQGLTKSAAVAWLSGARRRIGMGGRWGREASRWLNNHLVDTGHRHAIERGLKLLEPLGIQSPEVRFDVPATTADRDAAEEILKRLDVDGRFVLIASGAGWPSKLWPLDRYAAVAAYLGRRWNLPSLVIWGNDAEQARAQRIIQAAEGHARLCPKITLMQLAAIARRAHFAIGSDTGPLHLAAAAGTPCIGLYGPWPAEQHGPYGPQHINLQRMVMVGTTHQRRHAPPTYMEAIDTGLVFDACDRMMANRSQEAA
jgi:heptosyltransferase I